MKGGINDNSINFRLNYLKHAKARAVAITAISQYRAFESITAEECNNRSNRDISFFFFFFKVMPFSFYT